VAALVVEHLTIIILVQVAYQAKVILVAVAKLLVAYFKPAAVEVVLALLVHLPLEILAALAALVLLHLYLVQLLPMLVAAAHMVLPVAELVVQAVAALVVELETQEL
jgi:hypothetical protein